MKNIPEFTPHFQKQFARIGKKYDLRLTLSFALLLAFLFHTHPNPEIYFLAYISIKNFLFAVSFVLPFE
jgi:hypothetical protein